MKITVFTIQLVISLSLIMDCSEKMNQNTITKSIGEKNWIIIQEVMWYKFVSDYKLYYVRHSHYYYKQ